MMAIGKSKAKIYVESDTSVRFDDVAGVDEAKEELREIVEFLKNPEQYSRLGGRMPKGILLVGPPGTARRSGRVTFEPAPQCLRCNLGQALPSPLADAM
jgi:ATP-dependent Zn protease